MSERAGSRSWNALRIAAGLAILAALVFFVDLKSIVDALSMVSVADLAVLFLIGAALILISVLKWRAFLARLRISASLGHLYRLYLVGYFVNLVMPSYVGGDVVRSLYVGPNVDRAHAVSATLLERYTGFMAMVLMSLVALPFSSAVTWQMSTLVGLVAAGAVGGSVALFSRRVSWLGRIVGLPERWTAQAVRIEDGLVWGITDPRLICQAALLSAAFHVMTIVNTVAVAHAVGWEAAPWGELFVVVPLILLVGAVPISPQGLGIQEGAFLFFLQSAGASGAEALAVALVLRAKSYVLALVGGILWLGVRKP